MTNIERKALALLNEVRRERGEDEGGCVTREIYIGEEALCRAIERHEAFRQEVSDAVEVSLRLTQGFEGTDAFKAKVILERFIIAKPDPLVDVLADMGLKSKYGYDWASEFRTTLAKRGLEIREIGK